MAREPDDLEWLVARVLASGKYCALHPAMVRTIGAQELATRGSLKAAVKATKGRLHQIAGAFLERTPPYSAWLTALRDAAGDTARIRAICLEALKQHASTRERLPDLERFYPAIFAALPPVRSVMDLAWKHPPQQRPHSGLPPVPSVMDLAWGLNPLAAPWMPLVPGASYLACDLYADLSAFVGAALPLLGLNGVSGICDLTGALPPWRADVALLLKTLPLLEHTRRGAGRDLLHMINAPYLVVSFPTRSLGGRNVGMATRQPIPHRCTPSPPPRHGDCRGLNSPTRSSLWWRREADGNPPGDHDRGYSPPTAFVCKSSSAAPGAVEAPVPGSFCGMSSESVTTGLPSNSRTIASRLLRSPFFCK